MAGQEIQEKYRQEKSGGEESVQNRHGQKKRGHREIGSLILMVPFFAALLAVVHFYLQGRQREVETEGPVYETNIVEGGTPERTPEERQRELGFVVGEVVLAMSIDTMSCGKTIGTDRSISWLIENPSNRGKLIRVEVWKDDTAERIYEIGAISSGSYVEVAPLSVELPPGGCRCTTRFYAYKEDETYIGQVAAQIQLVLQE